MIRPYKPDDTDAVVAIWRAASALAHPFLPAAFVDQEEKNLRDIYLPNAETYVSEEDGVVVGFIALIDDEIGGLFLQPTHHGKGRGRAMVDHAVGVKGPLPVEVFQRNDIGRRFYERYGFAYQGEFLHEASGEVTLRLSMPSR